ncbi:MAG: hypothetical protein ACUVWP_05445 [bacterium]
MPLKSHPKITPIFLFGLYPHFLMDDGLTLIQIDYNDEQTT